MSELILVDSHNKAIGAASTSQVQRDLLYHRETVVIAQDEGGNLLLRKAVQEPLRGRFGVTGRDAQRVGEEPLDTAERMLREVGLIPLRPLKEIGDLPASWGLGFAFLTIFTAEVHVEQQGTTLVPLAIDRCSRLIDFAGEVFTYHLCQALRFHPEFRDSPALSRAASQFFEFPEGREILPSYGAVAAAEGAEVELLNEINNHQSRHSWIRDLLGPFENIRPYYPAPYGLEVGELLLGAAPIARGIEEIARVIAGYRRPLRVVGKLESGRIVADRLERALRAQGCDVDRFDVATTWVRHGEAQHDDGSASRSLTPRLNLICDTMISSGVTFNAIRSFLIDHEGGDQAEAVVIATVDRSRYYFPSKIHAVRSVEGHDWIVGFNSDAPSQRGKVGRALPFLATLKPRGTGTRAALIENLV